ncbi:hypothetical protein RchiOBHm_Chr7g0208471 [Rosa chinensis]|uniref:Uncharacterized protein n=1 Tax=Rosa chinensis TaxID=74649 RepID=A0A2P6P9S0_ROSCH|nr:hypothetical protein RchiOBHm_Chr7g0208471 [Rosa chinensis]
MLYACSCYGLHMCILLNFTACACPASVILDFDFHMVFGCASKFQLICYMLYRSRCSYQAFFGSVGLLVLLQILCHI